ncbi:hypothetical protein WJX72_006598 [[Myrmecia] bisecta]|uniref:Uncharacterized protein n=1 Tax=[Myrmecia] bisecta TaxID=41462 RepID=A0AAW1P6M9_9CHLO
MLPSVDVGNDVSILLNDNPDGAGVDVVESAHGDLNKPFEPKLTTIYPLGDVRGLNPLTIDGINNHIDLGNVLPSQHYALFTDQGTDCAKSLKGKDPSLACPKQLTAQRAVYGRDTPFHSVTICACDGAPFDFPALAAAVAKVPQFLLQNIKGVTAINVKDRNGKDRNGAETVASPVR